MKKSLSSRLDRHFTAASALAAAAAIGGAAGAANAAIVYSGPVSINIPSTTQGVYLNVVTGVFSAAPASAPGWDVNPFSSSGLNYFNPTAPSGGVYVLRAGGGAVANLPAGTAINATPGAGAFLYGSGTAATTGNQPHILSSSNNLIGFRFQNEANANQIHYGWMRISLDATLVGQPRAIVEYAYESDAGVEILAGSTTTDPNFASCCLPNGTCSSMLPATCTSQSGTPGIAGSTCASANCPTRCCKPDGTCAMLSSAACTAASGVSTPGSSCAAACPQPGACCTPDGTSCSPALASACAAAGNIFRGEGTTCATCGVATTEIEPNEDRVQATPVTFAIAGDSIRGNSTGSASTVAGTTSLDQFLVKTPAMASGIYRNRLEITSATAGHTGSIRALNQVAAPLGAWPGPVGTAGTTDNAMQTSSTTTSPARMNQWYGFGKQEQLYYRVTGGTATTADYFSTWTSTPVTPTTIGPFAVGDLSFDFSGQGHTTDSELWIYDSNLNAIDGFGNDDRSTVSGASTATTSSLQSFMKRTFAAGTYYAAVSNFPMSNDKGSPCDDNTRTGAMMDFPNSMVSSSATAAVNVSFAVTDSAAATTAVAVTRPGAFDVMWFKFTVGNPGPTCYANCDGSTGVPFLNVGDFTCFLQKFAAQDAYANCDGSTAPPTLNVGDFTCFLTKFAASCSAP